MRASEHPPWGRGRRWGGRTGAICDIMEKSRGPILSPSEDWPGRINCLSASNGSHSTVNNSVMAEAMHVLPVEQGRVVGHKSVLSMMPGLSLTSSKIFFTDPSCKTFGKLF